MPEPSPNSPPMAAALTPEFHALYQQELPYVFRSLRRLGVRGADMKDVTHEVFLVAWRRFDSYQRSRPVRPWLFGISYRVAADYRARAQHRELPNEPALAAAAVAPSAEGSLAEREAREVVMRALEGLPEERRAVFILHELDGCAAPEIADTLGIPINTVYSRLRVARREFTDAAQSLLPKGGAP